MSTPGIEPGSESSALPTAASAAPGESTQPLPTPAEPARRASRAALFSSTLVDGLLVALLAGSYAVVEGFVRRLWSALFTTLPAESTPLRIVGAAVVALLLYQWILTARRGTSIGLAVHGIGLERAGGAPGFLRGVFFRSIVPFVVAFAAAWFVYGLTAEAAPGHAPRYGWSALAFVVVRLFGLLSTRLAGLVAMDRGGETVRAYEPPRFSGSGFLFAVCGLVVAGAVGGAIYALFTRLTDYESTDLDVPLVLAATVAPLVVVLFGSLASHAARRFLVSELALASLLAAWLLFDLFSLGVVPVAALQRFELASWLDWSVYAIALYFGAVVLLLTGSALGFMRSRDVAMTPLRLGEWLLALLLPLPFLFGKVLVSRKFEWQVARQHLRFRPVHFVMLALVATLVPVLVYGVLLWPILAVWRAKEGRAVAKPMPPTVFMSLLTIVGVMFGVMSLTVVLAVMGGFERDLKEKILGTNAHGVVHRFVGDFDEWKEVQRKIAAVPGVEGSTPFIMSEVMITTDTSVTGAVLKGIDVETVSSVTDLEKYIDVDDGTLQNLLYPSRIPHRRRPPAEFGDRQRDSLTRPPPAPEAPEPDLAAPDVDDEVLPGIVIGNEMKAALNVSIGDRVTVMNPLGELGPTGPVPRSRVFRVAAVFMSGMYEYDSKFAYIQLREAQRFFRMGDAVTGIELRFANVDEARPLMRRITNNVLEGFPYRGKDWGEMNKNLFSALRLERVVMFILLSFQVLIACICVVATLVMLVVEKRKEVATLKAMGAREGSIMKLFVVEGLVIGGIGTLYGSVAGFLFCKLIEKYGVGLDPQVYYITRLPVVIEPGAFAAVAVVAMVLVFVATIYPARRGGSIAPVEGFREE